MTMRFGLAPLDYDPGQIDLWDEEIIRHFR